MGGCIALPGRQPGWSTPNRTRCYLAARFCDRDDDNQEGRGRATREGTPLLLERSDGVPPKRTITAVLLHHQLTLLTNAFKCHKMCRYRMLRSWHGGTERPLESALPGFLGVNRLPSLGTHRVE